MNDYNPNNVNIISYFSEIIKKGLIYSSASIFQQLLNFFLIPLYTLYLTPKDFGIIAIMSTTVGIVLALTKTPLAYGFVRFYYSPEFSKYRGKIYFNSIINVIIRAIIPAVLFYLFSNELSEILLGGKEMKLIIVLYSFIILFQPLEDMSQDLLKIQKKAKTLAILQIINLILTSFFIIILLALGYGVYALIYGVLLSTLFPVITLSPYMLKNMVFSIDFKQLKPIYKYGNPLILLVLSQFLMNNIDFYIIKSYLTIDDAGLYSFASKFGALLGAFLIFPIRSIFEPVLFKLESQIDNQKELLQSFSNFFFIISLFLFSFISIFSEEIVVLFASKKEFYSAWSLIPIISFAFICFGMMDYFGKGLEIAKRTKTISIIYFAGAISNIILNILLIHYFALLGVALSKVISFLLIIILTASFSKKHYGITFPLMKYLLIASPVLIFSFLIQHIGGFFSILIIKILFISIFSIFLLLILNKCFPVNLKKILTIYNSD